MHRDQPKRGRSPTPTREERAASGITPPSLKGRLSAARAQASWDIRSLAPDVPRSRGVAQRLRSPSDPSARRLDAAALMDARGRPRSMSAAEASPPPSVPPRLFHEGAPADPPGGRRASPAASFWTQDPAPPGGADRAAPEDRALEPPPTSVASPSPSAWDMSSVLHATPDYPKSMGRDGEDTSPGAIALFAHKQSAFPCRGERRHSEWRSSAVQKSLLPRAPASHAPPPPAKRLKKSPTVTDFSSFARGARAPLSALAASTPPSPPEGPARPAPSRTGPSPPRRRATEGEERLAHLARRASVNDAEEVAARWGLFDGALFDEGAPRDTPAPRRAPARATEAAEGGRARRAPRRSAAPKRIVDAIFCGAEGGPPPAGPAQAAEPAGGAAQVLEAPAATPPLKEAVATPEDMRSRASLATWWEQSKVRSKRLQGRRQMQARHAAAGGPREPARPPPPATRKPFPLFTTAAAAAVPAQPKGGSASPDGKGGTGAPLAPKAAPQESEGGAGAAAAEKACAAVRAEGKGRSSPPRGPPRPLQPSEPDGVIMADELSTTVWHAMLYRCLDAAGELAVA